MKDNKLYLLIGIGIMGISSFLHYGNVRLGYEQQLGSTGLLVGVTDQDVREENEKALEDQRQYEKLLEEENGSQENTEDNGQGDTQIPKKIKLNALSSLLLDASNQRVLYEENGYKRLPMASTTKIMTCLVVLEQGNLQDVVTVSSYAASMPDVQLNIRAGEQYYLGDLIYSLMLESHNDVAVAIAEHIGGSVEGFAALMNEKAKSLDCNNTNFVTPSGLDATEHYTTARDLAVIASHAIQNEKFIEITNTPIKQIVELTKGRNFTVTNKNKFLYMMEGAIGVKTGFTNGAGYCFVGAVKKLDRTLVSVVLGSGWPPNKNLKWSDTKALINYGIDYYEPKDVYVNDKLDSILVADGVQKEVAIGMEGNFTVLLRKDESIRVEYEIPKVVEAPVENAAVVGKAKYYINDTLYKEIPIGTLYGVEKIDFEYCIRSLFNLWTLKPR